MRVLYCMLVNYREGSYEENTKKTERDQSLVKRPFGTKWPFDPKEGNGPLVPKGRLTQGRKRPFGFKGPFAPKEKKKKRERRKERKNRPREV